MLANRSTSSCGNDRPYSCILCGDSPLQPYADTCSALLQHGGALMGYLVMYLFPIEISTTAVS